MPIFMLFDGMAVAEDGACMMMVCESVPWKVNVLPCCIAWNSAIGIAYVWPSCGTVTYCELSSPISNEHPSGRFGGITTVVVS